MEEWIRTEALIGPECMERLKTAHITVAGAGGVGGYVLEALTRAGIGRITLFDGDTVSVSNRNRQILALSSTLGQPKTKVATQRLTDINPHLILRAEQTMLTPENIPSLLTKDTDFLIDCIDDTAAKLALADWCRENQVPLIMCLGTGNRLSSRGLTVANFDRTEGCPLAKKIRLSLKKAGYRKLRVLYSADPIQPLFSLEDGGKRTVGSISFVPSIAGLMLAEHTINRLIRKEENLDIPR